MRTSPMICCRLQHKCGAPHKIPGFSGPALDRRFRLEWVTPAFKGRPGTGGRRWLSRRRHSAKQLLELAGGGLQGDALVARSHLLQARVPFHHHLPQPARRGATFRVLNKPSCAIPTAGFQLASDTKSTETLSAPPHGPVESTGRYTSSKKLAKDGHGQHEEAATVPCCTCGSHIRWCTCGTFTADL